MNNMKQIPLAEATDQQLVDFAEMMQFVIENTTRGHVLAVIGSAWHMDYILATDLEGHVDDVERLVQTQTVDHGLVARVQGGLGKSDPKFVIKISTTEQPGGKDPVPVSVNGRAVVIQRGMPVELPARYYYALRQAVRIAVDQNPTTYEIFETEHTNYPIEMLKIPSEEALTEWHERVNNELMPA